MELDNKEQSILKDVLLTAIQEQKRARKWKIFFRCIILLVIVYVAYKTTYDKNHNKQVVAQIDLTGIIGGEQQTFTNISKSLHEALEAKNTVGVIIKANSPGGSPVYSDMLYKEILQLRKQYPKKPIYVAIEEICTSGCYYIASAANEIYANPASIIGSIGVIYINFGITKLMQHIGIDNRLMIAGNNKAMGNPFTKPTKLQNRMQQKMLDQIHLQFINAVINTRGNKLAKGNKELFSGRYWLGEDAVKLGLIDGYSTIENLAKNKFNTTNIVDYTTKKNLIDMFSKNLTMHILSVVKNDLYTNVNHIN